MRNTRKVPNRKESEIKKCFITYFFKYRGG